VVFVKSTTGDPESTCTICKDAVPNCLLSRSEPEMPILRSCTMCIIRPSHTDDFVVNGNERRIPSWLHGAQTNRSRNGNLILSRISLAIGPTDQRIR